MNYRHVRVGETEIPTHGDNGGPLSYVTLEYEDGTEIGFNPSVIERMQAELTTLRADNLLLSRFVRDQGTTCWSCPTCGHAMSGKGCPNCRIENLRAQLAASEKARKEAEAELSALKRRLDEAPILDLVKGPCLWAALKYENAPLALDETWFSDMPMMSQAKVRLVRDDQ